MAETPVTAVLPHRRAETEYLASLNDRFANYVSKVHAVQEQTKSIENATLVAHAKSLSDEITSLKDMYEVEINKLRTQLDTTLADKNAQELSSNKHIVLSAELEAKYHDEVAVRKKVEAALGETHRLLSEKDACIAELHISVSEHKQKNADLTKEKDSLTSFNSNLQEMHDNEATKRTEIETKYATLQDQMTFNKEMHAKDMAELNARVNAADMAIKIAEERLKEHDNIDDQLAATLAKVKQQSHAELLRFQEEAEFSYLASLQSVKNQLEESAKNHAASLEENIRLKAKVDDLTAECRKESSKAAALDNENKTLIKTAEIERNQFATSTQHLEARIRQLQEDVNTKIRELSAAYNSNIPVDVEIEAFSGLLDAEEKRLQLSLTNPAPEIITRTSLARPHTGSRALTSRPISQPIGVAAPPIIPPASEAGGDAAAPSGSIFPPCTPKASIIGGQSASARAHRIYNMQQRMNGGC